MTTTFQINDTVKIVHSKRKMTELTGKITHITHNNKYRVNGYVFSSKQLEMAEELTIDNTTPTPELIEEVVAPTPEVIAPTPELIEDVIAQTPELIEDVIAPTPEDVVTPPYGSWFAQTPNLLSHQHPDVSYLELYDKERVQYLSSLSEKEIFDIIDDGNKKVKFSWNNASVSPKLYAKLVRFFLKKLARKINCEEIIHYKYAEDKTDGRLYVSQGLQNLQTNIRNDIAREGYRDWDMSNAHPTILLQMCKNTIKDPKDYEHLQEYVSNREHVLSHHNLDKQTVLKTINQDETRTSNNWLKGLSAELYYNKKRLLENSTCTAKEGSKHPLSSKLNQELCKIENMLLQRVINKYHLHTVSLVFDGFMTNDKRITEEGLNEITKDYNIIWKEKPIKRTIEIPEDYVYNAVDTLYEEVKREFEQNNHIVLFPYNFKKKVAGVYRSYTLKQFSEIYSNMAMYGVDGGADTVETWVDTVETFIQKWVGDKNRKEYDTESFLPYNKVPAIIPDKVFNTFAPFTRVKPISEATKQKGIAFFHDYINELIFTLCEESQEMAEYLINYIAHLIQYPETLPEVIICLKGGKGTGKDTLIEVIQRMLANKDYVHRCSNPEQIFGRFNGAAENKLVIQINESKNKDAIDYLEQMKDKCTALTIPIEKKGHEIYECNNLMRLFIVSNNNRPVIISKDNRRFFVTKSSNKHQQDKAFWEPLNASLRDDDTIDGLFWYFNEGICLDEFNTRDFPRGQMYDDLMTEQTKPIYQFLYTLDTNSPDYFKKKKDDGYTYIKRSDFRQQFTVWCSTHGNSTERMTTQAITLELADYDKYISSIKMKRDGAVFTCYKIQVDEFKEHLKTVFFSNEQVDDAEEEEFVDNIAIDNHDCFDGGLDD